jgi:Mrp family chromosome partitioning ATPase
MVFKKKKKTETNKNEDQEVKNNIQNIKHTIVIMSGKGGVGKSTIATNLAFSLSMRGAEVGLLDVDITGPNIPKMLNIENERLMNDSEGIQPIILPPHLKVMSMAFLLKDEDTPVIWRGPLKMQAIQQFLSKVKWGNLDYLIIDLPPGTGDEPLSVAQLIPNTDGAIIVTTPQDVAVLDSRKAVNFAKTLKMPIIGIIENMSGLNCPYCQKKIALFKNNGGVKAAKDFKVPFLGKIPIDPNIVDTCDNGKPFVLKYSDSKSTEDFENIVEKIEYRVNGGKTSAN